MIARTLTQHWLYPGISSLGLILFFAVFTCAAAWIFQASRREGYESIARLPLDPSDDIMTEKNHD